MKQPLGRKETWEKEKQIITVTEIGARKTKMKDYSQFKSSPNSCHLGTVITDF